MADAEDLKSSGDFSSCGFDSHPGHQFVCPALAKDFLDILCLLAIITSGQIMARSKAAASVAAFSLERRVSRRTSLDPAVALRVPVSKS